MQSSNLRIKPGYIRSALASHPEVAAVIVEDGSGAEGEHVLRAFVVPSERGRRGSRQLATTKLLDEWRAVYAYVYREGAQTSSADFGNNFSGWLSSYDRTPIPEAEMEDWRERAVAAILSLRPRRVLEIGAGSGLILSRVAPHCERYWATDLSESAVSILRKAVDLRPELKSIVELRTQPAHVFDGLPADYFDLIVMNSVIQYFPSPQYLVETLHTCMNVLAPGGAVFAGDVRNLRLAVPFHSAIELCHADAGTANSALRDAIRQRVRQDRELVVDPAFFGAFAESIGGPARADVMLKRGRYRNELTRHRYDVVLYRPGTRFVATDQAESAVWGRDVASLDSLRECLATTRPAIMELRGVPNERLAAEIAATRAVEAGGSVAEARERLLHPTGSAGIEPEDCYELAAEAGYQCAITWAAEAEKFDILFMQGIATQQGTRLGYCPPARESATALADYISGPLSGIADQALSGALTSHLKRQFPDVVLNIEFAIVDALPAVGAD